MLLRNTSVCVRAASSLLIYTKLLEVVLLRPCAQICGLFVSRDVFVLVTCP